MKIKSFLAVILTMIAFVFLTSFTYGQANVKKDVLGGAVKIEVGPVSVDSVTTTTFSRPFSLPSTITESTVAIYFSKLMTSAGTPKVTTIIQGSDDNVNWAAIDTVGGVSDSLKTVTTGTIDLNSARYWFYRFQFKGETGNRRDVTNKTILKTID